MEKAGREGRAALCFSAGAAGGRAPPPTQLHLCRSCNTESKQFCKREIEISCSDRNNQFPFPWHRKSRHQTVPHSLRLALPTALSWLQMEIQLSWKTSSSLIIHPVSELQNRKFIYVNKSCFPLILAIG